MRSPCPMERRLFFLLSQAQHRVQKRVDAELVARHGLTSAQQAALYALEARPGCLLGDLARALGHNASAITGLVGRMEAAGLVERRPCAEDGRAMRLWPTAEGRARLAAADPLRHELNRQLTDGFTADEVALVARYLETIRDRF